MGIFVGSFCFQWALVVLVVIAGQKVYWHSFFKWLCSRRVGKLKMFQKHFINSEVKYCKSTPLNTVDRIFLL